MPNAELAVEPGGQVSTTVTVYNASAVVEEYTIEVLGPCAGFAQAVPDEVSLLPGDDATIEVMFSPPAGAATEAGRLPFGVRAISGVDDYYATVVEGTVDVGAVHALDARLVAVTGSHRWVGRYRAEFTNNGTAPIALDLAMMSEAEDLGFALAPTQLDLGRAESGETFIKVRPRAPFFVGAPRRHTFQLAYQRSSEHDTGVDPTAEGTLDGTFEQRPVASRRLLMTAGLAVAALIALIALLPQAAPPAEAAVPPPTPLLQSVEPVAADAVQLTWTGDPAATGYRIDRLLNDGGEQQVVDSASVGAERAAHRFEGLEPATEHCFQLVALNDAGPSDPTPAQCATTLAVAPSEQPGGDDQTAPATAPPGDDGDGDGDGGNGASEPAPGADGDGGGDGANGAATDAPGETGGAIEPDGAYVIYGVFPIDDTGNPADQPAAQQLVADLQQAGVENVDLVDSRRSETFLDGVNDAGLVVVFRDEFASQAEAQQHCNEQREVAPVCAAFAPRPPSP